MVGIQPCSSENQRAAICGANGLLSGELAAAVDAERNGFIFLGVWRASFTVEDVIGGKVDQQRAEAPAFLGQQSRRDSIDLQCDVRLGLGAIHGVIRGGVEDYVGPNAADELPNARRIGKIELLPAGRHDIAESGDGALQLPAELTVLAGDEDLQRKTSAWRSGVPRWSLSFRMGLATGHRIPTPVSFQSNTRSCCGE